MCRAQGGFGLRCQGTDHEDRYCDCWARHVPTLRTSIKTVYETMRLIERVKQGINRTGLDMDARIYCLTVMVWHATWVHEIVRLLMLLSMAGRQKSKWNTNKPTMYEEKKDPANHEISLWYSKKGNTYITHLSGYRWGRGWMELKSRRAVNEDFGEEKSEIQE